MARDVSKVDNFATESSMHQDSMPIFKYERKPLNPGLMSISTLLLGFKYLIWGAIILLIILSGAVRYIGDWVISRSYPSDFYAWGGFSIAVYIVFSLLTLPLDWYREHTIGLASGLHAMHWVSTLGRWLRRTFIDAIGLGLLSFTMERLYFTLSKAKVPDLIGSSSIASLKMFFFCGPLGIVFAPFGIGPDNLFYVPSILAIVVVPLWFLVRDTLLMLIGNGVRQVPNGTDRQRLNELGKMYRITILDIFYFELGGDYNAESRLFGFFGIYFLFVPGNLAGKEAICASASKAIARAKVLKGTIQNSIRWLAFTFCSFFTFAAFNWSLLNPHFTWFTDSAQAGTTGDPSLVLVIMLIWGIVFMVTTPLVNWVGKAFDKMADRLATSKYTDHDVYASWQKFAESGKGFDGPRDRYTDMALLDTNAPSQS